MVVLPTEHPSVDLLSAGDILEARNKEDEVIKINDRTKKQARDDFTSMEPAGLSARCVEQRRVIPCARSGVLSPSRTLPPNLHSFSSHHHSKVPQSVTITDSKASSTDWSPLPFQGSRVSKPVHHAYPITDSNRKVATSFSEMSFLRRPSSFIFDYGSLLDPPSLISRPSSQYHLLGQPMIQSPAPISFSSANRPPGSMVRRHVSSMTPLSENSFHPTMFSIDSTTPGQTPYSENTGTIFRCNSSEDAAIQVVSLTERSESITFDRTGPVPCTTKRFKKTLVLPTDLVEAAAPILSSFSTHTPPRRTQSIPRVHASKMLLLAATKRAPDDDSDDDLEKLFCTCPKSRCLKLYCVCFQRAILCDSLSCKCSNCKNTMKHAGPNGARTMAMVNISKRRHGAFGKREKQVGLGCSCKRNKCLKKYCACYAEGTPCDDDKCGCVNCHNEVRPSAWFSGSPLSMGSEICPV